MRIDKKKASTLFALTLLIVALLLVNMNGPTSATPAPAASGVSPASIPPPLPREADLELYPPRVEDLGDPTCTQWHELHPSKTNFYHLAMWEPGRVLSPEDQIDMYATDPPVKVYMETEFVDPFFPFGSEWHETSPTYCQLWVFSSWEDNGDGYLSPCDQIDMKNLGTGDVVWFHVQEIIPPGPFPGPKQMALDVKYWFQVDEVTVDMSLSPLGLPGPQIFVEYKCGYWTFNPRNPICTKWNQIDPEMGPVRCLHLTSWEDNGDEKLSPSDIIDMTPLYPNPGPVEYYHVDFMSISLKLSPKPSPPVVPPPPTFGPVYLESEISYDMFDLANPVCTYWHEIYPVYSTIWHLSSWENSLMLSPSDQILLRLKDELGEPIPGAEAWYHVDKLTVAMNLTDEGGVQYIVKFEESLKQFKQYHWMNPISTQWHEVNPVYCRQWHLSEWYDSEPHDYILGRGDFILMIDKGNGTYWYFRVESLSTDMWVTQKIHDVAVVAVSSRYPWVYQGQIDPIDVNVTNLGNLNEPIVDVYAFYDTNLAAPKQTTSLNIGETKTLTFSWNTAGVPPGIYTISANATIPTDDVPGNNNLTDGTQEVRKLPTLPRVADLELYPRKVVDLGNATSTQWHELYPNETNFYHLTSWEPGRVLSPEDQIDMYATDPPVKIYLESYDPIDLFMPRCTTWHEFMPMSQDWHFSSWEDTNGDGYLSPCDQIDMTNLITGDVVWFHVQEIIPPEPLPPQFRMMILDVKYWFQVDEVTVDMSLSPLGLPGPQIFVEYKCGYWTFNPRNPISTKWNQIDPGMGPVRCLHLTSWNDTGPARGKLDPSDTIDMTIMYPYPGAGTVEYYHVDFMSISLMLSPKPSPEVVPPPPAGPVYLESTISYDEFDLANPVCTKWHEIYPYYCRTWHLSSWEDSLMLSPSDQIVLTLKDEFGVPIPGAEAEYHVDKLTVAMNLTSMIEETHIVKFEGSLKQFKKYNWSYPWGTQWHEVNPQYCRQWYLLNWSDTNGNGYLDYCDLILMMDKGSGMVEEFHVESLSTDMWVTQKICGIDITNVTLSRCGTLVNSGYTKWTAQVNVAVHNNGTIAINCTVNAYYSNATITVQIGTQPITNLAPCNTINLTFNWNLAGLTECRNYTLKANATCGCEVGSASDEFVYGNVYIRFLADIYLSNKVDWVDLGFVGLAYGSKPGDANWNVYADIDAPHCKVDWVDLGWVGTKYGQRCP